MNIARWAIARGDCAPCESTPWLCFRRLSNACERFAVEGAALGARLAVPCATGV